jgi:hypothetical protein
MKAQKPLLSPANEHGNILLLLGHPCDIAMCCLPQDCGALRAAHAGVALSDAEASIVSPFTGKTKSVRAVVELLLEGRGMHARPARYLLQFWRCDVYALRFHDAFSN